MLQMMTKHYFILHYISKMLFQKFYLIQKNVSVIFASKLTNFTDFYDKLLKNLYYCNFKLNLVKKNYRKYTVILPDQNFTIFLHL